MSNAAASDVPFGFRAPSGGICVATPAQADGSLQHAHLPCLHQAPQARLEVVVVDRHGKLALLHVCCRSFVDSSSLVAGERAGLASSSTQGKLLQQPGQAQCRLAPSHCCQQGYEYIEYSADQRAALNGKEQTPLEDCSCSI